MNGRNDFGKNLLVFIGCCTVKDPRLACQPASQPCMATDHPSIRPPGMIKYDTKASSLYFM